MSSSALPERTGSPTLAMERPALFSPATRWLMKLTDIGFIVYWAAIALGIVPARLLFDEYELAPVAAWNWSFLPLDLVAALTGLVALRTAGSRPRASEGLGLISLTLTATAGGMAISYWAIRGQFDISWWLPNVFLLVFPTVVLTRWFLADPR